MDTLFNSKANADKVLVTAYSYLSIGLPTTSDNKMGGNNIESITDLQHSSRNNINDGPRNLYYNASLNANTVTGAGNENYRFGSESEYYAIRYAAIFIENANRITDATQNEKNSMIAEAKVCMAIAYYNLLRYCGGVPILEHSVDVNDKMFFPRNTFAETVDFIVGLCDEAAGYLPWVNTPVRDGRMTKAAAMALKLRVLCFAASDTFNSDQLFHPAANKYHCYTNYDKNRWKRAKDAADDFMRELKRSGFYKLVQPTDDTPMARRLAYRAGYFTRGTSESIISLRKGFSYNEVYGYYSDGVNSSGPTLNWANMFEWADGTEFPEDFNWESPDKQPFFTPDGTGKAPGIPTRDPRLYENIAVPGDIWWNGTVAPLHTNSPNYRPSGSGFNPMKFLLQDYKDRNAPVHWPYLRFAEVLLNAAEAYNEYDGGPSPKAYEYVNDVRARVGLPGLPEGMDKLTFRKALIKERACEFGYEEVRWFDMIRWGLKEDFQKKLYGLSSKGNDQNAPTEFTFKVYELPDRAWVRSFDTKWYLAPIPQTEIDKNYGMTQNPGWQY